MPQMNSIQFDKQPESLTIINDQTIHNFSIVDGNIDVKTVEAFGDEWTKFNHFNEQEITDIASKHYFDIVEDKWLIGKKVLDVGCGTGRWTKYVAKYAESVDAIDPSKAIETAAVLLKEHKNVRLSKAAVDNIPFADNSFDFVFSLGVLHHIPDTQKAMQQCINKLNTGGYFLTYLYYNFDNRGFLFRAIFSLSTIIRKIVSKLPSVLKNILCDIIAIFAYLPLILLAACIKGMGLTNLAKKVPLYFYVGKTFNVIRNDARDRFGTPLEQRFSKNEIEKMMQNCGLVNIVFSPVETYWHAVGQKK